MAMLFDSVLASPITWLIVGYFALVLLLAVAVHPLRRRMVALGEEILHQQGTSNEKRARINGVLDRSMSFWTAWLLPLAILNVLIDATLGRVRVEPAQVHRHDKMSELVNLSFLSMFAANPIAAVISIPLMAIGVVVFVVLAKNNRIPLRDAAEEPILRAAAALSPQHC
jgi:hypothetical protein